MTQLQTYTKAQIEQIKDVGKLAELNGVAKAAMVFYKAKDDHVMSQRAKELYFRSARQAGTILLPENTPREEGGRPQENSCDVTRVSQYQEACEQAGISRWIAATWQKLALVQEELFEIYIADPKNEWTEYTIGALLKIAQNSKTKSMREEMSKKHENIQQKSDKWHIYHGNIETWEAPRKYDFIIADPPYQKRYLELYEMLAIRATEWLKDGGLLVAMCGQANLNKIYKMMDKHLAYHWTAAYMTPGPLTQLYQRKVMSGWKPLLIYSNGKYIDKTFSDVFISNSRDKSVHDWGQSVSGMYDIVSKICSPGQYILDPFCGSGTTGLAALEHGCLFDGLDVDIQSVNISKGRLSELDNRKKI